MGTRQLIKLPNNRNGWISGVKWMGGNGKPGLLGLVPQAAVWERVGVKNWELWLGLLCGKLWFSAKA